MEDSVETLSERLLPRLLKTLREKTLAKREEIPKKSEVFIEGLEKF